VLLYGPFQISGSSVVKKKDALSQPPQGCGSKLSRRCLTLTDAVRKANAHIMERKVGVQVTSFALSAATVEVPVCSDGVWHNAQPVLIKSFLPLEMESARPARLVTASAALEIA